MYNLTPRGDHLQAYPDFRCDLDGFEDEPLIKPVSPRARTLTTMILLECSPGTTIECLTIVVTMMRATTGDASDGGAEGRESWRRATGARARAGGNGKWSGVLKLLPGVVFFGLGMLGVMYTGGP